MEKENTPETGIYETEDIEQMKARLESYRKSQPPEAKDWRDFPCGFCRTKGSPEWLPPRGRSWGSNRLK